MHRILVINPGSTTTKIAVFEDEKPVYTESIVHTADDLKDFVHVVDQYEYRKNLVLDRLEAAGIERRFDAVVGRGGLVRPIEGGVYHVNERLRHDLRHAVRKHACNLGCLIAHEIAQVSGGCPAFMADPVVVDELCPEARVNGSPLMPRQSIWHALNHRAIARRYARERGCRYEDLNLIVAHLGGGISVAAHCHGKAVDVNNALDGEGPFSPERAGTLPSGGMIRLCFSGKYTEEQLLRRVAGKAGLNALLGTSDVREVLRRIEAGDEKAALMLDAMTFHIAKAVAAEAAVFSGQVDAILLTGGLAHAPYITERIERRVRFIAPVSVYPGEDELLSLAEAALGVLRGEYEAKEY